MGDGESSKKRRRKRSRKSSAAAAAAAEDTANAAAGSDNEDATATQQKDEEDLRDVDVAPAADANANDDGGAVAIKKEDDADGDDGDDDDAKESKKRKRKRNRKKKSSGSGDAEGAHDDNNAAPADSDAAKLASTEHTVFIEGLPFTSSEDEVRSFFAEHGCRDVLQLRLPTWQDSGRLRGFGHVVFASTETRARALSDAVNGRNLGGRYVTVKEANAPRAGTTAGAGLGGGGRGSREQPKGCKTVFVRNLPYNASEEDVQDAFRTFGKILEGGVRVVRNHSNGQSKGFGYVEYKNEESALAAVQKAAKPFGLTVMKRPVFVDYDEGSMKGSFRDKEGKLWSKEHGSSSGAGAGGRGRGRSHTGFGRGHR